MKYKRLTAILALALAFLCGGGLKATAQEEKQCYGIIDNEDYAEGKGIYSFDFDGQHMTNIHLAYPLAAMDRCGGACYVDGVYYWTDMSETQKGHTSNGFYAYDLEERSLTTIVNWGSKNQGDMMSHLTYDYTTRTMYGLWGVSLGYSLGKIDLETGEMVKLNEFTVDGHPEVDPSFADSYQTGFTSIACNYDGDLYGINYFGGLYRINKVTSECTYIAQIDFMPEAGFPYNHNDLFFDNDTERLYFRVYYYDWEGYYQGKRGGFTCLWEIDPQTAHVEQLEKWYFSAETHDQSFFLDGIHVPFQVAEASAPAKVQNLEIKRGDNGALTATLSWDNPSKTYARGGTLEELTAVVVYRDGEEVWRNDSPVIGGHETFTDQLPQRGYYSYRIVGFNAMGKGDRVNEAIFIGEGDPLPVSDITLTSNGSNAIITWTEPVKGKYDAWINTANLRYDIVRQPDQVEVGTNVSGNSFTDTTIPAYGKYSYSITAKTTAGSSQTATSSVEKLGPAYQVPFAYLFDSQEAFDLWTAVDANGNWWTWAFNNGLVSGRPTVGAGCYYGNDEMAANDWLISPRIALKGGQHYKFTFDATPINKRVPETLAIAWADNYSTTADLVKMDSLTQWDIVNDGTINMRVNLPVLSEDQERVVAFFYRSYLGNYGLTINNVKLEEDHDGYIAGVVTNAEGQPVSGATVRAANGRYQALTDAEGRYVLNYLPAGKYTIQVVCLGYQNKTQSNVVVAELETTTQDVQLTALPTYEVKGRVIDVVGDPVSEADVNVTGYNTYVVQTDAEGRFTLPAVFKNNNYAITISHAGYVSYSKAMPVSAAIDLGDVTLDDDVKAPKGVSVAEADGLATVTWSAPQAAPRLYRNDDGGMTTSVGYNNGSVNNAFGVINPVPATVYGVQFFTTEPSTGKHEQVLLRIVDLDEQGMPTHDALFEGYVPCNDDEWTAYTLPAPIEAPNGYYACLSYDGFLGIGIDGAGDSEAYPFKQGVNCFGDFVSGTYYFLDNQSSDKMRHNFMLRTMAAPYADEAEARPFFARSPQPAAADNAAAPALATQAPLRPFVMTEPASPVCGDAIATTAGPAAPFKTVQDRVRYNVYRMLTADTANEAAWTLLSEKQQARSYSDAEWATLPQGTYRYAVKAVYTGDKFSTATHTDSIGHNMLTTLTMHIETNTPDEEWLGARIKLTNGRDHTYQTVLEDDNRVTFADVWKGQYQLTITLDGFRTISETLALDTENSYSFDYTLTEELVQPFNLIIEDVDGTQMAEKRFVWNFPDSFFDDFEEHEDFVINSPGAIGWNYIDGDQAETGGFSGYDWNGMWQPMAFIVFNAYAATTTDGTGSIGAYFTSLRAHSGEKCLQSWAAYNVPNDDWFITPRLYFKRPFKYSFYAQSYDAVGYAEQIEVRYSTTGMEKDDFTEVLLPQASVGGVNNSYYNYIEVEVPAEAKYVAIHHVSNQRRVLSIDDVFVGYDDAAPARRNSQFSIVNSQFHRKSPALDGQYEVYLDGVKVADTDETSYVFAHLTPGQHVAGVLASYTSGKTAMSTIVFESTAVDGIGETMNSELGTMNCYDLQGRRMAQGQLKKGVYITDGKKVLK